MAGWRPSPIVERRGELAILFHLPTRSSRNCGSAAGSDHGAAAKSPAGFRGDCCRPRCRPSDVLAIPGALVGRPFLGLLVMSPFVLVNLVPPRLVYDGGVGGGLDPWRRRRGRRRDSGGGDGLALSMPPPAPPSDIANLWETGEHESRWITHCKVYPHDFSRGGRYTVRGSRPAQIGKVIFTKSGAAFEPSCRWAVRTGGDDIPGQDPTTATLTFGVLIRPASTSFPCEMAVIQTAGRTFSNYRADYPPATINSHCHVRLESTMKEFSHECDA
jgi:hypothetical protein